MAVLLFILRLIGWILLALLVILLAALVLPLGIRVSYHPGSLQVRAYYGPLQFTLWPRGGAGNAPAAPQPAPAPAPTAEAPAPAPATASDSSTQAVTAAVQAWASAWAAKDMKAYLAAYDKSFDPPGNQNRAAWEKEREARIVSKSRISVKLSDINVSVKGDKATARFRQAYSADALNVTSRKTLDLVHNNGRWTIVRESTGG